MIEKAFGLIGYPLSHSFSKKYFADKFEKEQIKWATYDNFPLASVEELPDLIQKTHHLRGLNVTIPYKEQVIPYLDFLSHDAREIGAVNTIVISAAGLSGYNSDIYGFDKSLDQLLDQKFDGGALILGTGGASKAVAYVLNQREIPFKSVSRHPAKDRITYQDIDKETLEYYRLIINTTPLGMHPNLEDCPDIPYRLLGTEHYLYDLIYNPAETKFLTLGKEQGAKIKNGLEMLILQAERSWEIWNMTDERKE